MGREATFSLKSNEDINSKKTFVIGELKVSDVKYMDYENIVIKLVINSPHRITCGFTVHHKPSKRFIIESQDFPLDPIISPREISRLAKNMFKWIEQQMEKV